MLWEIPEEFQTLGFAESYRGHEGLIQGLERFSEVFESWEIRPDRALDLGDRVLALGSFRGKARASGVELEQEFSQLVTLERGLVVRDRFFYSLGARAPSRGAEPRGLDLEVVVRRRFAVRSDLRQRVAGRLQLQRRRALPGVLPGCLLMAALERACARG